MSGKDSEEMDYLTAGIPNVGICFDTNHLLLGTHEDFVNKVGDRIKTLHISDYDGVDERHWVPYHEQGIVDGNKLYKALRKAGYKGVFMFEVPKKHGSPKDLVDAYKRMKR